ncbi:MAG: glutathione-disulfide reductase [Myxococcota bacterium]|nr:glutathione-disulfide reductase [Myxococcota bacterium]
MTSRYDLVVIGAGSGGVRASRIAASLGARVAVCEVDRLGGTCVNLGCVPKKLFVHGSALGAHMQDAEGFGWTVPSPGFDWHGLTRGTAGEVKRLNGVYRRLLEGAGVDLVEGHAVVVGPHEVEVSGRRLSAENILVATGSWPFVPDFPGNELAITSNEAFSLPELPRRAVVVGGGYIAVEFAGIYRGLGVEVCHLHRGDQLLRGFDHEVRSFVTDELRSRGVQLRMNTEVRRIDRVAGGLEVTLPGEGSVETDLVFLATGRRPRTQGLGLEQVGVELGPDGAVLVDDRFHSSVPSIHAVGDVIDRVQLTPVALSEGMTLARNLFGGTDEGVDYTLIPTAVFGQPPIGTVGLTQEQAQDRGHQVVIYRSTFRPLVHTVSGRAERTMVKLVVDRESDRVLGCHMVGADAAEIVQGLAVALTCGATKAQFDATLGIHPTSAEEFVTLRTPVG